MNESKNIFDLIPESNKLSKGDEHEDGKILNNNVVNNVHLQQDNTSIGRSNLGDHPTLDTPAANNVDTDIEALSAGQRAVDDKISYWKFMFDHGAITQAILLHKFHGSGTVEDPYKVTFLKEDPRDPMLFPKWKKWSMTMIVAFSTLAIAFVSSAYAGGTKQIIEEFGCSTTVALLGLSLFVLGFAVGPLVWAPLSEILGRQILFFGTYAALTAFNAGAAGAQNIEAVLITRFFAGAFGSSTLTNAGGVIADMFPASERGLAMAIFAAAPFMGPVMGPTVGGFLGESAGWRWVGAFLAMFSAFTWQLMAWGIPETYTPLLLRARAKRLSQVTGKCYVSKLEADGGAVRLREAYKIAFSRPWIFLFREPIVLMLSVYMSIIYGTLYMLFAAFPIIYQQTRGWSQGIGGLAFLGVAVGMMMAVIYTIVENKRYIRNSISKYSGNAPPEARLPPALVGSVALPIGLFWFAWTNSSDIHWLVSIAAGAPFGFGMVLVFLSVLNYLIDSYTIFAASVLAANTVLRSIVGAAFPLFTGHMYKNMGNHWASSLPAFLALACAPAPFLFYKYGEQIRLSCRYAAEAADCMRKLREDVDDSSDTTVEEETRSNDSANENHTKT